MLKFLLEHLKKLGKEIIVVSKELAPANLKFLPGIKIVSTKFSGARESILSINTASAQIDKLGYRKERDKVNLIITPKAGSFSEKDIKMIQGGYKYDLIIVLDSSDLERLGPLYEGQNALFYETPVVNIDHHPGNAGVHLEEGCRSNAKIAAQHMHHEVIFA